MDNKRIPATEYHEQTKHSPRSVRSGPGLNFDNEPSPYKTYTNRLRESLPDPGDLPESAIPALEAVAVDTPDPPTDDRDPSAIDRERLAELCYFAAGVTTEIELRDRTVAFRAAACTGALYHVDLYPVCGNLPDLDAGVYHYDPRTHSLDVLRTGDYRGLLAAASDHEGVADAPVTFVVVSEWWRNAWKYRERTFRHAFWDSGTVLANLLATAHDRGLPASAALAFADEPVVDLLGLDPTDEAPLELVPVGSGDRTPDPPVVEPLDPETKPLSSNPREFPLVHRAWRAGTLSEDRVREWRNQARKRAPIGTRSAGGGECVVLDPVDSETASARPLDRTIHRRGSCREFAREPVSFRKLSTVLDRAVRGVPIDAHNGVTEPLAFADCYLLVNAVDGLEPGAYQFHPTAGELEELRAGEFRQEAGHLALDQRLAADAAVCVYFLFDPAALVDALDDRGYRLAQFESAATAGRLYLATYAHRDLGGTGLTFYDDLVTDFFSPRAEGQTPAFLYTLGRPA